MKKSDFVSYLMMQELPVKYLLSIVPAGKDDWCPVATMMPLGKLVTHIAGGPVALECMVTNQWPESFSEPRSMGSTEAIAEYHKNLLKAIAAINAMSEDDWQNGRRSAPWAPEGPTSSYLLSMMEHISHHKMQLYCYLKMLGVGGLDSGALYFGKPTS